MPETLVCVKIKTAPESLTGIDCRNISAVYPPEQSLLCTMKYPADILEQIINLGIQSGDLVLLTGDSMCLEDIGASVDDLVRGICEILGPKGTLVVPEYEDAAWALNSQDFQGSMFSEALKRIPGNISSNHPTHPFVAVGRLAVALFDDLPVQSPFGRDSVPFRMLQVGAKQLMLFDGLYESPFVYLAEKLSGISYTDRSVSMNTKLPSGKTVKKYIQVPGCGTGFRNLEDSSFLHCCENEIVCVASARDIYNEAKNIIKDDRSFLLCDEPDCDICAQSRAMLDATEADDQDKQVTAFAEEEETTRQDLERRLDGRVTFYETDHKSINLN